VRLCTYLRKQKNPERRVSYSHISGKLPPPPSPYSRGAQPPREARDAMRDREARRDAITMTWEEKIPALSMSQERSCRKLYTYLRKRHQRVAISLAQEKPPQELCRCLRKANGFCIGRYLPLRGGSESPRERRSKRVSPGIPTPRGETEPSDP